MSKFTVKAEDLSAALNLVLLSAELKTTMPWLAYALIEAKGDRLKVSATDMDMSISVKVESSIETEGSFCVKAKQLRELLSLMRGDVVMSVRNNQVWCETDTAKHRLPYLPEGEFRFIEAATDEKLTISGEVLAGMVKAASIGMETNPNGQDSWKNLEFSAKGGQLSVTGMCGPRAATVSVPCESELYVMLPSKAVNALAAFAANSETLTLFVAENHMTVRFEENEATFKLSGLKWSDWTPIRDAKCEHKVEIDSESFALALRRSLLASDRNRIVSRVDVKLQSKEIDLFSESLNGEGNEKLPLDCPTLNGDALSIALDGAQLLDLFKIVKGGVVWELSANHTALRFTPKESLPFSFTYIQGTLRK